MTDTSRMIFSDLHELFDKSFESKTEEKYFEGPGNVSRNGTLPLTPIKNEGDLTVQGLLEQNAELKEKIEVIEKELTDTIELLYQCRHYKANTQRVLRKLELEISCLRREDYPMISAIENAIQDLCENPEIDQSEFLYDKLQRYEELIGEYQKYISNICEQRDKQDKETEIRVYHKEKDIQVDLTSDLISKEKEKLKKIGKEKKEINEKYSKANNDIERYLKEIKGLNSNIQNINFELKRERDNAEFLKNQNQQSQRQIKALESSFPSENDKINLQISNQENANLLKQVVSLNKSNSTLQKTNSQLNSKIEELKRLVKDQGEDFNNHNATKARLKEKSEQCKRLETKERQLETENLSLKNKVNSSEQELNKLKEQLGSVKLNEKKRKKECDTLSTNLANLEEKLTQSEHTIKLYQSQELINQNKLSDEIQELKNSNLNLKHEIKILKETNNEHKLTIAGLNNQITDLKTNYNELKSDNFRKEKDVSDLEHKINTNISEIQCKDKEIEDLRHKLTCLQQLLNKSKENTDDLYNQLNECYEIENEQNEEIEKLKAMLNESKNIGTEEQVYFDQWLDSLK